MPVLDHDVHPSVKVGPDHRYGCWNKPRTRRPMQVKAGFKLIHVGGGHFESVQMWKTIDDFGSLECRYDGKGGLGQDDPACAGCEHYKVSDYVQQIIANGK